MVSPRTQLRVHPAHDGDGEVVLRVGGELDLGTVDQLRAAAGRFLRPGARLTLDLSGVTFCDSTGLSALVSIHKQARAAGGELVLVDPVARIMHLFTITGLVRVLHIRSGGAA
jgi:anti-sigma B factor antagonist